MEGVWYAAVAAAFLLGVTWIVLRRSGAQTRDSKTPDTSIAADAALRVAEAEASFIRHRAIAAAESSRQVVDAEAAALRASAEADAATLRAAAEADAQALQRGARRDADRMEALEANLLGRAALLDEAELRVAAQESRVDASMADVDRSLRQVETRERDLEVGEAKLARKQAELGVALDQHQRTLEHLAGLTADEARAELLQSVEASARRDAAVLVRSIESTAQTEGADRARAIVAEAVQRVASHQTTESVVSVLHLPGDDMKGRIIGREGRNIRAFEAVTGVNVIIDDTPEAVLLSCFDPMRREVGRLTMEKLVGDGRIHPQRIEDLYEQSRVEIDALCLRAAQDALAEVGVGEIDERLLPTIGRLKYRTSYGQNVLAHLIETAHIAGVMAAEMGIEPTLIKRCAFLHDIGKALTHEVEGSHAIVGAELLRRFGEAEAVAHAVEAHHNEVQPRTIEAVLTQASDTCSAARPGARRESVESYVKRLTRIEEIASGKSGVEKVFAMQAGREVRVMVQPSEVDDLAASVIAREIAKEIEDELTYPGQIRVTVVRESRTTEIAH